MLLSACLPDGTDSDNATSDAGKLGGAYYSTALSNVALQIQSKIINDATWFSNAQTMELPLQSMNLSMTDLGPPIRSYACPTNNGTQLINVTWLDGRDESGKFALKTIGADTSTMFQALRMRLLGEQVGTYNGSWIRLTTGDSQLIPSSCGSLPIPTGAPVVVFTITQPARPTQDMARTEFKTVPCPQGQIGTQVERRMVTYRTNGTIQEGDWKPEDMGACINSVDIVMDSTYQADGAAMDTGFAALANIENEKLKRGLENLSDMGCTQATVTRKDAGGTLLRTEIDTGCEQRSSTVASQVEGEAQTATADTREIACGQDWSSPLQGFNIPGLSTTSHWEGNTSGTGPGKAVIRRVVGKESVGNTAHGENNAWEGVSIDCAGKENFTVQCDQLPGAPAVYPQQSGSRTYWSSNNNGNWYNYSYTNTMLLNKAYFTGVWLAKNENVRVTRPIRATKFADKAAMTPDISRKDNWTISDNQCIWVERVMYADCPSYDPVEDGPGTWDATEGYPGFRPPYIVNFPTQSINNAGAWMFSWWQQKGEFPMHADVTWRYCNNCYYNYYYPLNYYAPEYIRRQTKASTAVIDGVTYQGDSWTTLLNKDGVLRVHKARLSTDRKSLNVQRNGYYEPLRCGRDEAYVINGQPVHVYRMFSSDKGWSRPQYSGTVPISGVCGTAKATPIINENTSTITGFTPPEASDLCVAGVATSVTGSGPWNWQCKGIGGGTDQTCEAARPDIGTCGSANGQGTFTAPSTGLCATGSTASTISGSGPWSWSCAGSDGSVACSAPLKITGQCGGANGAALSSAPTSGLCVSGMPSGVAGSGPWNWLCLGSHGGATSSCSASVICPAVTQPTCTGSTHFVASPNDSNGCATLGSCVQTCQPPAINRQEQCDLQEWNGGPAIWFIDEGNDENTGCWKGGRCEIESREDCTERVIHGLHSRWMYLHDWTVPVGNGGYEPGC